MSRVGKKPIPLPKGVKLTIGEHLTVEGPKGKLSRFRFRPGITITQKDGVMEIQRDGDDKAALHGLTRALAANAVQGVSTGFTRELQLFGVGYKVRREGHALRPSLWAIRIPSKLYLPDGIDMKVDKPANNLTPLILTGYDRQLLGQVAAKMRALRPPDPYKNKGVRYAGEVLRKKVGKTGATR